MRTAYLMSTLVLTACAANAAPPVPSLSPARTPAVESAEPAAEASTSLAADDWEMPESEGQEGVLVLTGRYIQGGLITGRTDPDNKVLLDGEELLLNEEGYFVFGFGRDHPAEAVLTLLNADGDTIETQTFDILKQNWKESHVTVEDNKVNPYKQEDLDRIATERELKKKARSRMDRAEVHWSDGFIWPAIGCISSHFGYQRFYNGVPRRYHSGVDLAAPDHTSPFDYVGTPIYAPAPGRITLAEDDMFFEGGLVFIDHGQLLESALMHMSKIHVEAGQFVNQGDLIGEVGGTGRVSGPHLHWSLKWKDRLLDPPQALEEQRPDCTPGL